MVSSFKPVPTVFDRTADFSEIKGELRLLKESCELCGIPFLFQAAVKNTKTGTDYMTETNFSADTKARMFDNETDFSKSCRPHLTVIKSFCVSHAIPFYFCAMVKRDSSGTSYEQDGNFCGSNNLTLAQDKITDHLRVCNGFQVIPPVKGTVSEDGSAPSSIPEGYDDIIFSD